VERINLMLLGAIALGFFAIALFFFRFWRQGRDRFFLLFAMAFWIEGCNRIALGLSDQPNEGTPTIYLVRLAALVLILVAILDKNGAFGQRR
jgi:uncharacterized membrane protein HdeD (DUF308 family)